MFFFFFFFFSFKKWELVKHQSPLYDSPHSVRRCAQPHIHR